MMAGAQQRFDEARAMFAVANTPLFLLRKLQADSAVLQMSRETSSSELLELLKLSVSTESPNSPVLPYVFLVALALRGDIVSLRKVSAIVQSYPDTWLAYIASVLIDTFRPIDVVEIKVPSASQMLADQPNTSSNSILSFSVTVPLAGKS